jgi:hypothetical protein
VAAVILFCGAPVNFREHHAFQVWNVLYTWTVRFASIGPPYVIPAFIVFALLLEHRSACCSENPGVWDGAAAAIVLLLADAMILVVRDRALVAIQSSPRIAEKPNGTHINTEKTFHVGYTLIRIGLNLAIFATAIYELVILTPYTRSIVFIAFAFVSGFSACWACSEILRFILCVCGWEPLFVSAQLWRIVVLAETPPQPFSCFVARYRFKIVDSLHARVRDSG